MDKGIHFISGLPRSGSTLLSAILRQNPAIHAHITSPLGPLCLRILREMSEENEGAVFINDEQRKHILRGAFSGYYHDIHVKQTVFDTNRLWCAKLPILRQLFPQAKIICCVRDLPAIYESVERLVRRNAFSPSRIFSFNASGTVYDRFEALAQREGLVGFAWTALRQAYYSEDAGQMMLARYESLTENPGRVLDAIYDFVGLPRFRHCFDEIDFDAARAFDIRLGLPGLHDVKPRVARDLPRTSILPPDLIKRVMHDAFWNDSSLNAFNVKII